MLKVTETLRGMYDVPRIYFTLAGNSHSEEVIRRLSQRLQDTSFLETLEGAAVPQELRILRDVSEVQALFESGISKESAVVLFDSAFTQRRFTFTSRQRGGMPDWSCGAQWGVKIGNKCVIDSGYRNCSEQVAAHFNRNFQKRLFRGEFPWGRPRKGESPPVNLNIPDTIEQIRTRLNQGPDLAASIADKECALELPRGSRISWIRIPHDPLQCDVHELGRAMSAFSAFERASSQLIRSDASVAEKLFAGVDVDPSLREAYLYPNVEEFSVRRPDLHFTGDGVFASENDEMPGGFAELAYLDLVYGINQEQWKRCFDWLTSRGRLLFVVSHVWSKCYIPEIAWLTNHLRESGYDVGLLTTDQLDKLTVSAEDVYDEAGKIGTVWRQFPIFEATGKLIDLVKAAHSGRVRMVPEFAHFGNKTWFSIFRSHLEFFRKILDPQTFSVLDQILPDSQLVRSASDFPLRVDGVHAHSVSELQELPAAKRDSLVMKLSGANTMTARSYGVLMGHGLNQATWRDWISERLNQNQPFIVQRRLETGIVQLPVFNTKLAAGEIFNCRVLLRPWMVGGEVVSVHSCAVPSNTLRVHGRVDMAVAPVRLE